MVCIILSDKNKLNHIWGGERIREIKIMEKILNNNMAKSDTSLETQYTNIVVSYKNHIVLEIIIYQIYKIHI